jgi:DegV family protein with EDD domain
MAVMVVTDSSARLQPGELESLRIGEVPLHILVDGVDLRDGVDDVPGDVHDRAKVSTAGATPAELAGAYSRALAASDGDGVVAVHISAALSSTFSSATQAAKQVGPAVRVVDSRSAAMGTGFVVLAAARAAAAGADVNTVEHVARWAAERGRAYIVVHRLDSLRRSGRIGTTKSWVGTALSLKPLLGLDPGGRLVLVQRIRTATKARAALVDQIVNVVGDGDASMAVHHVDNVAGADEVAAALTERLPQLPPPPVSELGPVLAIHLGAGTVAAVVNLAPDAASGPRDRIVQ